METNFFFDISNEFLCYKTSQDDMDKVDFFLKKDFSESNLLNGRTVYNRQGSRMAGILGEIVFDKYMECVGLKSKFVGRCGLPYDFIVINRSGKELRIDVKCKLRKVPPKKCFEASFFAYQSGEHFKDVNFYVFMSTIPSFEKVWLCALSAKKNCVCNPHGKLWKAGDVDPSNGMTFREDTWCVGYQYMTQFPQSPQF